MDMTLASRLQVLVARLGAVTETPRLDAEVLAAHILGVSRAWVIAHPQAELDPEQSAQLERAGARLVQGEPLPYVLGHWDFYGERFMVSPAVLIPRPETELLVEQALDFLRRRQLRQGWAADVGTGSGIIAISLAKLRGTGGLRWWACDRSAAALQVARENARRLGVAPRIHFVQCDLLQPMAGKLHLLCANLPYVPDDVVSGLQVAAWEPRLALAGGADGLDLVRRLLAQAVDRLLPGGLALFEIEASQGAAAHELGQRHFPQAQVQVLPDLAGRDRLLRIELPNQ